MSSRYSGEKIVNGRLSQIGECFWEIRGNRKRRSAVFRCECGKTIIADHQSVVTGRTLSCGCLAMDVLIKRRVSHGATSLTVNGTRKRRSSYHVWAKMLQRCENPNNPKYRIYGARGISVDQRWKSYECFVQDMGERPDGLTLDRVDVNGNYCKENCRWATLKQQSNNTRSNVVIERHGVVYTLKQLAESEKVNYKMLWKYVRGQGQEIESALLRCKKKTA